MPTPPRSGSRSRRCWRAIRRRRRPAFRHGRSDARARRRSRSRSARWARPADRPPPLNLVLAPQAMLNQADLWPGWQLDPSVDYPSRYVPGKRTLYVADAPGFERDELPFAVALHVLAATSLSDADCRD